MSYRILVYNHRIPVDELDCFSFVKKMGRNMTARGNESFILDSYGISLTGLGLKNQSDLKKNFVNMSLVKNGHKYALFTKGYSNCEYSSIGYYFTSSKHDNNYLSIPSGAMFDLEIKVQHLDKKYHKGGYVDIIAVFHLLDGVYNDIFHKLQNLQIPITRNHINLYTALVYSYDNSELFKRLKEHESKFGV